MIVYELDIDMCAEKYAPTLTVSKGDTDFGIILNLYNSRGTFDIESGTSAKLRGRKPDGSEYEVNATLSGKRVIAAGDSNLTDVAGRGILEVCLTNSGRNLLSQNFPILIEKAADGGNTT